MTKPIHKPKQNPPTVGYSAKQSAEYLAGNAPIPVSMPTRVQPLRPGFVHHLQKSMEEWSVGTKLTVFHMPVDGVVWVPDHLKTPGAAHNTPKLAMHVVFVKDDMFFAFGTGPDKPTQLTLRLPRSALLNLLAKSASMDMQNQEKRTYYLDEDGNLLETSRNVPETSKTHISEEES